MFNTNWTGRDVLLMATTTLPSGVVLTIAMNVVLFVTLFGTYVWAVVSASLLANTSDSFARPFQSTPLTK
jgi:hypothetical protein